MRLNREFKCEDEDGNIYTVQEWQSTGTHKPLAGPKQTTLGARIWRTSSGFEVHHINDTTYEIIHTDTIIRRI